MPDLLDIVDDNDIVVGNEERGVIHEKALLHRSVHIFVFNSKSELFIQKRSFNKSEHPEKYDSSAAGHLEVGESYDEGAQRELEEELGISPGLRKSLYVRACPETEGEFVWLYTAVTDDEIRIDEEEIQEGFFWTLQKIKYKIKERKEEFTPAFCLLFDKYLDF